MLFRPLSLFMPSARSFALVPVNLASTAWIYSLYCWCLAKCFRHDRASNLAVFHIVTLPVGPMLQGVKSWPLKANAPAGFDYNGAKKVLIAAAAYLRSRCNGFCTPVSSRSRS